MATFVISDTHFGHEKILEYANRPFGSALEMDNAMIDRWNAFVDHDDTVLHLGDFTLLGEDMADYYFRRLNGHVIILYMPWHHDKRWAGRRVYRTHSGHEVHLAQPMMTKTVGDRRVHLSHYPLAEWDRQYHGGYQLHGHTHGNLEMGGRVLDVSADCINFAPILIEEALYRADKNNERGQ